MEEWRDIPGYEGKYQVSDRGRVKSCARHIHWFRGRTRPLPERVMQTPPMYRGYLHVHLKHAGDRKRFFVHQLVAIAFLENPDGKPYVNHIDRDKRNNHISNLEWVTEKENTAHWMADDKAKQLRDTGDFTMEEDEAVLMAIAPEDLPF